MAVQDKHLPSHHVPEETAGQAASSHDDAGGGGTSTTIVFLLVALSIFVLFVVLWLFSGGLQTLVNPKEAEVVPGAEQVEEGEELPVGRQFEAE